MRVIAAVLHGQGSAVVKPLHETDTLAVLASFLPPARTDASGAVTASSVVQPPREDHRVGFKVRFLPPSLPSFLACLLACFVSGP